MFSCKTRVSVSFLCVCMRVFVCTSVRPSRLNIEGSWLLFGATLTSSSNVQSLTVSSPEEARIRDDI